MQEKIWSFRAGTGYILRRSVQYAVLSVLAMLGYILLVSGLSVILGYAIPANNPFLIGFFVLILALTLDPLRDSVQRNLDAIYLKRHHPNHDRLQEFADQVTKTRGTPEVIELLRRYIEEGVQPRIIHIYVYDTLGEYYFSSEDQRGHRTSDMRFSANGGLVRTLMRRKGSILLEEEMTLPVTVQTDLSRLAVLGAILIVPLFARDSLAGFLALGPRSSGEKYSRDKILYIESLGAHVSQAIERAQVVTDLQRRIYEMNILARVAEGINITLAFDDTLELFYAQTTQLIPSRDMHIALLDENRDDFYYAFCLENDERLQSRENRPLPSGLGLETEVIQSQRVIVTGNYEQECLELGLSPNCKGVYAWMGVPLKAGSATIGAVSLASRDPAERYTQDQVDLLRAIANMAAGAIVKVRLLEETEFHARQMELLNEVTHSLTSTLEVDILLDRILRSAIEILGCESGNLLLVDEKTGQYVVELAVGPEADELVGKRKSGGSGLVGKGINTGRLVIQNNAKRKDWFDTDEQTGYQTEDLLVVPLEVKGRVLGALELFNKRDRSLITVADQELLSAFAGQASVALDNARMYTTTDRALAARIQELSVLQRVDQELNASLELERTMRITLGWAIRQTRADAGFAGLLAEDGIQVVVSQGYVAELESFVDERMPLEIPVMKAAVNSGQIQLCQVMDADRETIVQPRMLSGARSQAAIPVGGRSGDVIGLIFLESRSVDTFTDDRISFFSRLSDHAAIAISNAQLYSAVQAANLSKSQFVSSAVHELKNPLTSIKGYSDLLMAGSVGPISEGQNNFLETIRTNVDRMAMLVSDLQDISRIESGQLRLEFGAARIDAVIQEVVQSFSKQLEGKAQRLHLDVQAGLPLVWGDRGRLVQILTNLVSNAHKYTCEGGEIHIKAEHVNKSDEPFETINAVHIYVKDSGIGISKEDQVKIFQQFFRSEEPEVRQESGTGLGLSITKNLVEMQGGRIWFQSVENGGTTFHFTIPIAEMDTEMIDEGTVDWTDQ